MAAGSLAHDLLPICEPLLSPRGVVRQRLRVCVGIVLLTVVVAACGGGGGGSSGTVSAAHWVATVCRATGSLAKSAPTIEQSAESKITGLLVAGLSGNVTKALTQARTLLVTMLGSLGQTMKTFQSTVDSAGTPNITNGAKLVATLHADVARVVS